MWNSCVLSYSEKKHFCFFLLRLCCDSGWENIATLQIIKKRNSTPYASASTDTGVVSLKSVEMGFGGCKGDQLHKHLFAILLNMRKNLMTFF